MENDYPLDAQMLDSLRALQPEGGPDVIIELFEMFQTVAPPLLEKIRVAAAQGDSDTLYKSAHSLKGDSASLGASILAAQLKELEQMGRMKKLSGVSDQLARVEREYTRALTAFTDACQK
ncbi:MAG: Hpt domain-containing protein [Chloroflexi bacterium]|nr:Hpt domain-containing protein [Chloroflexota bacterium]